MVHLDGGLGLGILLRLGGLHLHSWVLHISLLNNVGLDGLIVGPRGLDSFGFNPGNFVINSSFTSSSISLQ